MADKDYGEDIEYFQDESMKAQGIPPVELRCKYVVPGLTMHDLSILFDTASKHPSANEFSGDPSKWPTNLGIRAVVDAVIYALKSEE